jgi:hypothetical protein
VHSGLRFGRCSRLWGPPAEPPLMAAALMLINGVHCV